MSDKPKKKFRNTRVGKFLTKKLPAVLGIAGDILPDAGLLNKIKSLIEKEPTLSKEDKEHALMLIEMDKIEMQAKMQARLRFSFRNSFMEGCIECSI